LHHSQSTDTIGRCKAAACQLAPAVIWHWFGDEARTILT
jgi:hypothetical protein